LQRELRGRVADFELWLTGDRLLRLSAARQDPQGRNAQD
jgi:hypothetical protein